MGFGTDTQEPLHLFTVEDYHRMIEAGIFGAEDRVELLEGAIVEMSPEGPAHAEVVARLTEFFILNLRDPALRVRPGNPITLPPISEPEPDLAVVDRSQSTMVHHPYTAHLLIEVAMTSLRRDRIRKARIYARAEVPEYWVVDLVDYRVHVHKDPVGEAYTTVETIHGPAELRPSGLDMAPLSLTELFAG